MAILGDQHLAKLNTALEQLAEAQKELALAKRSGLQSPVPGQSIAELESKINDLSTRLTQVKQTYFPNQR